MTQKGVFKLTDKQKIIRKLLTSTASNALVYGGSRSGKTFLFVYAIITRALKAPFSRHAIFRKTSVSVKQSIGLGTYREVIRLAYPELLPHLKNYGWKEQYGYFTLPNGSEIWLCGLDDKDRVDKILGNEYVTLYFNETSEIPLSSFDVACTRLSQTVMQSDGRVLPLKCYVDLNPTNKSHWTYRLFVEGIHPDGDKPVNKEDYVHVVMNPHDNEENLSKSYLDRLEAMPERQRKRFLLGEYTGDSDEALWKRAFFIHDYKKKPEFRRIIVAIDPSTTNKAGSDETGIIVAGIDLNGHGFLIDDLSAKQKSPQEWATIAINAYHKYGADRIVAETNQGGDMVETIIKQIDKTVAYRGVHATRGKVVRAEPIAALYEQKRITHLGEFNILEDQLCSFDLDFDRKINGSPDRLDALVWAFTDLMLKTVATPRIR